MSTTTIKAPPVQVMIIVQLVVILVMAAVTYLLLGKVGAYSTVLGGLISTVPNAYYAHMVFRHRGASAMSRVIRSIYVGEVIKLVMMGAGFAMALILVEPLDELALFAGFVLVHVAGMVALVRIQPGARQ